MLLFYLQKIVNDKFFTYSMPLRKSGKFTARNRLLLAQRSETFINLLFRDFQAQRNVIEGILRNIPMFKITWLHV